MKMPDYEISLKIRNAPLLNAMRAKGMHTAAQLHRASGVAQTLICSKDANTGIPSLFASATSAAVPEDVITGALFDFLGYLTTRDNSTEFGACELADPAVTLLEEWAKTRGLRLDGANVSEWNSMLAAAPQPEDE
jgi:hypothetical protein